MVSEKKPEGDAAKVKAEAAPEEEPEAAAEPQADELLEALFKRLGNEGVAELVGACLKAANRVQIIKLINDSVGTLRLPAGTDRGRMKRLLVDGLNRRRHVVLDVLQAVSRAPFDLKAKEDARKNLDAAVVRLNKARKDETPKGAARRKEAVRKLAGVLCRVMEAGEARRLIHLNAFPDTVDDLLECVEKGSS
ncbi:MAG: hypothetical protein ACE5ID_00175 [Acidobacteriota bacterium]